MKHIRESVLHFLKQGVTPEKLALCIALGISMGIFPILGVTILLCFIVGLVGRLNQPVLQIVNLSMYPVQIFLIVPFYRLGQRLFPVSYPMPLSAEGAQALLQMGIFNAAQMVWDTTWRAVAVWGMVAPVLGIAVYFSIVPVLRRHHVRAEGII